MGGDGPRRDPEHPTDLSIGMTRPYQLEDLPLSDTQFRPATSMFTSLHGRPDSREQ